MATKYIFITGGGVSSLGKGVAATPSCCATAPPDPGGAAIACRGSGAAYCGSAPAAATGASTTSRWPVPWKVPTSIWATRRTST